MPPVDSIDPRPAFSAALRTWYWRCLRRYRYEICQSCGRPVSPRLGKDTYWFAPNTLWNRLHNSEIGVYCPACFTDHARRCGMSIGWIAAETQHTVFDGPVSKALEEAHKPVRIEPQHPTLTQDWKTFCQTCNSRIAVRFLRAPLGTTCARCNPDDA